MLMGSSDKPAIPESYAASGGGVGLEDTSFSETPPSRFAPRRKTIASRGPSETAMAGIASMAPSSTSDRSSSVVRGVSRSQVAVTKTPEPLTPAVIKTSVNRQMGKVRTCYERALKRDEGLSGKLVMGWRIGADGKVKHVSVVKDQLGSDKVSMCVIGAIATFKFPRGTETVSIEYPMSFKSDGW